MNKPNIIYQVLKTNDVYVQQDSMYVGTYTGDNPITVDLRIWNNYKGEEDIEDLKNFNIVVHFLTKEDNALLPYLTAEITGKELLSPIIEQDAVVFSFSEPQTLKGLANTGSIEDIQNYIDITLSFSVPEEVYLKDRDLKSLVLEIVEI